MKTWYRPWTCAQVAFIRFFTSRGISRGIYRTTTTTFTTTTNSFLYLPNILRLMCLLLLIWRTSTFFTCGICGEVCWRLWRLWTAPPVCIACVTAHRMCDRKFPRCLYGLATTLFGIALSTCFTLLLLVYELLGLFQRVVLALLFSLLLDLLPVVLLVVVLFFFCKLLFKLLLLLLVVFVIFVVFV